jgi:flagellar assembly protein FliH
MAEVRKFLFDRSFDVEPKQIDAAPAEMEALPPPAEEAVAVEEAEPVPTFSEEELEQARAEAFAAGREEGLRDAMGQAERRVADALDMIGIRLAHLMDGLEAANRAATASAVAVAAGIARKLLPELARHGAAEEVVAVVGEAMERVIEEPRIVVRVDAENHPVLEERLAKLAEIKGYEGRLLVVAEASLALGDCRIEWSNGGAERDMAALWNEIDRVIERNLTEGETSVAEKAE